MMVARDERRPARQGSFVKTETRARASGAPMRAHSRGALARASGESGGPRIEWVAAAAVARRHFIGPPARAQLLQVALRWRSNNMNFH